MPSQGWVRRTEIRRPDGLNSEVILAHSLSKSCHSIDLTQPVFDGFGEGIKGDQDLL